jgi:thiamine pyrophosphate-dependent acetolactate synthase large subunit-like protein
MSEGIELEGVASSARGAPRVTGDLFVVAALSRDGNFRRRVLSAVQSLASETGLRVLETEVPEGRFARRSALAREIRAKAARYFRRTRPRMPVALIAAQGFRDLIDQCELLRSAHPPLRLGVVFVDGSCAEGCRGSAWEEGSFCFDAQRALGEARFFGSALVLLGRGAPCLKPSCACSRAVAIGEEAIDAEAMFQFMQAYSAASAISWKPSESDSCNVIGKRLCRMLDERHGDDWLFFYYTGSLVSNAVAFIEEHRRRRRGLSLRGSNEHALASGSMACWQLLRRPFLIVVTSGMMDEFRGTLANLRETRARGLILCAENSAGQWFPFQGTQTAEQSMREVLAAKRIPSVFIEHPARIEERLGAVADLYDAETGPVAVMATGEVLECVEPADGESPAARARGAGAEHALPPPACLDGLVEMLNSRPIRILWQCGALDAREEELVYELAETAGIALADSMTHPGSVSKYGRGRRRECYLGTLGLYGTSKAVFTFLHGEDGALADREAQCIFLLKSKAALSATPFSEGKLRRALQLVQVTKTPEHIASFIDYPVVMPLSNFLELLRTRLRVKEEVVAFRRAEIARAKASPLTPTASIPTRPMRVNYFFSRLNHLLEELIAQTGYRYVGLFDVGRGGLSAIRNLARTDRGFSGWYGRALMGDALQAAPYVALASQSNVLAFVGDGAWAMTPSFIPSLAENLQFNGRSLDGSMTVFILRNHRLSLIETYQRLRHGRPEGRQARLFSECVEGETRVGALRVRVRTLDEYRGDLLRRSLTEKSLLSIFDVRLAHEDEGDCVHLLEETHWHAR